MRLRNLKRSSGLVTALFLWSASSPASGAGDYNGDGMVDLADYAEFPECLRGPGEDLGTGCEVFDFDGDRDVDLVDFAGFQGVFGTAVGVVIETVPVGNPGNPDDTQGYGGVGYEYDVGKYEVTAAQYTAFLNAVAATDRYSLYNPFMWSNKRGCKIQREGASGDYRYSVAPEWADRPVNYVSWGDAARFTNWLHNGQPTGAQDLTSTEDGSYFLNGATGDDRLLEITREPDASWVIPSEDEWYKAAYHLNDGPTGNYYNYPTSNDRGPSNDLTDPDPGNNATFSDGDYTIGPPYYRTEIGAHENTTSAYGTFDQGGNVAEWNEAMIDGTSRGVRGGSFFWGGIMLGVWERPFEYYPSDQFDDLGFRVAEVR
jgi:formylglycine-generating enzyme required for sulfatase activity